MTSEEIQTKLAELEQRIRTLESKESTSTRVKESSKLQSIREFLNTKKPMTANDRGLCIAYYYEVVKGHDYFNAEDIKTGFRDARIPAPKNPNDVINKNIAKAYMMDADQTKNGKKAWVLTATGEEKVVAGFSKDKK